MYFSFLNYFLFTELLIVNLFKNSYLKTAINIGLILN